jgi:hypothetical protein
MLSDTSKTQTEHYEDIMILNESPCTPKQQAGQFWDEEKQADSRNSNPIESEK